MTRLSLSVCLLFIIICLTFKETKGCSCFPTHPQWKFCSSDFAFVGKALSVKTVSGGSLGPGTRVYTLRLRQKLKDSKVSRLRQVVSIYTASNGAACGISLTLGKKYLLTGHVSKNKQKQVGLCDLVLSESSLTFEQMLYYFSHGRNSFIRNCACKDIKEYNDKTFSSKTGCQLPQDGKEKFCYFKTALCAKAESSCKWRHADCKK